MSWSGIGFALRNTAASLTALHIAFLLDLDSPKWAAMTVWIVAQGSRGMTLSKSWYRALGTLSGACIAILLIAGFAQTPELFLPALAVWIGLCTGVASALRNFRAYGAVLAGYTAAIIAMDSVAAPEQVFDIATARVTYVLLGILVEALFSLLFAPGAAQAETRQKLDSYLRQAAGICGRALRGEAASGAALHRLFAGAVALDTAAEYAAAASATIRRRLGHVRAATAATLAQLAAAQTLRENLPRASGADTAGLIAQAAALLEGVTTDPGGRQAEVSELRDRVDAAFASQVRQDPAAPGLPLLDRLETLLAALQQALARQAILARPNPPPSRLRFAFHIDRVAAAQNGIRATLAVLAAACIWIVTAWSSGSGFVTIVGVVCAIFATRDNPVAGGLGFLKGAAWSALAAGFCNFVLLPAVSGFAMLALVMTFFLVPGGIAMRHPRTAAQGSAFAIFFWDLVGPQNAERATASGFFNGVVALLLGMACATAIFTLLFPPDRLAARRRLHAAIRRDLALIGRSPGAWSPEAWLSRTADRLGRHLATASIVRAEQAEAELRGVLAALAIGDGAIRLQRLTKGIGPAQRPLAAVLRRLAEADPVSLARAARGAASRFSRLARAAEGSDGMGKAHALQRGAVLLREMAEIATTHAAFLRG